MKDKQIIISIGREYGSGGHAVANKLGERLGLKVYDKNIIDDIAREKNPNIVSLKEYDEKPKNRLLTRRVSGHSNSPEDVLANIEFDFIREKAEAGESFIVVGRCAESVLEGFDSLVSVFVTADIESRKKRISEIFNLSETEAKRMIVMKDRKRRAYHNSFAKGKWGDSRRYDLIVRSSKIGIDACVDTIMLYAESKLKFDEA